MDESYYADLDARQDAYDDLRDLLYHVTGGQPVPTQPVTHHNEPARRHDERRDAPRGRPEIFDLFRHAERTTP